MHFYVVITSSSLWTVQQRAEHKHTVHLAGKVTYQNVSVPL